MAKGVYSKFDIAVAQLERSIGLFLDEQDYFPAATLAGAAEEILGKMLRAHGIPNALDEITTGGALIGELIFGERGSERGIAQVANRAKNKFKHHESKSDPTFECDPEEAAADLIGRAIDNYFKLTDDLSDSMRRFQDRRYPS